VAKLRYIKDGRCSYTSLQNEINTIVNNYSKNNNSEFIISYCIITTDDAIVATVNFSVKYQH